MSSPFAAFFHAATGYEPFPFQERFANAESLPHLLRAPTGAGKTATAILGWLYRLTTRPADTPRRLVYCLPMRVLVEQSVREAKKWIEALVVAKMLPDVIPVQVLMGGVEPDNDRWFLRPEKPVVLIGTQDMLLSRALNRGFGASRFHWPIDFGLLNNDALWVYDEPQLMANGVATSAQLAGLRHALGSFGRCPSVWMSATLEPGWLDTIDFRDKFTTPPLELTDADYVPDRPLYKKMTAAKTLTDSKATATKDGKAVAKVVWEAHEPGTQTLVVVNTVDRAKAVCDELKKLRKRATVPNVLLVHSRFRPAEREALNAAVTDKAASADRIIVATQVVEAGVDISSRTLVTELAPWSSVVQRIGRCNRTGDDGPGRVLWVDVEEKLSLPYTAEALDFARTHLKVLEGGDVSPKALDDYKREKGIKLPFEHDHVVRRRDLLDLFDTAPDLSGNDIDVSRFVRSDEPETDVQVFWRKLDRDDQKPDEPSPIRAELCNVPVGQAREFVKLLADKKRGTPYYWDHLDDEWKKLDAKQVRPGLTILIPTTAGGYSPDMGWNPDSTTAVDPVPLPPEKRRSEEGVGSDPNSATAARRTVAQHTDGVCKAVAAVLAADGVLPAEWKAALTDAARWHDWGKAHKVFQEVVRAVNPDLPADGVWAKSGKNGRFDYRKAGRPFFRHELASALAVLTHRPEWPFAVAYLIAAHHGKVRLSIRAFPDETPAADGKLFAAGVWDGDTLGPVSLSDGPEKVEAPETPLALSPMKLGGPTSWTARALALRDALGPFRLAYLEAVLRAADQRVSEAERKGETP